MVKTGTNRARGIVDVEANTVHFFARPREGDNPRFLIEVGLLESLRFCNSSRRFQSQCCHGIDMYNMVKNGTKEARSSKCYERQTRAGARKSTRGES